MKEVERIVAAYLARQLNPAYAAPTTKEVTKEVIVLLGIAGLLGPNGQITLPSSNGLSDPKLIEGWLEKQYLDGARGRLGPAISPEQNATSSQRGTTGRVQRFRGGREDPVGASVYWSQLSGAYPVWGGIAQCYERLGGTGSRLGFPTSLEVEATSSQRGTTGWVQRFEGGREDPLGASISWSRYGGYPVWGGIAQRYEGLGGTTSSFGYPTSSEREVRQGTWVQHFEGGDLQF